MTLMTSAPASECTTLWAMPSGARMVAVMPHSAALHDLHDHPNPTVAVAESLGGMTLSPQLVDYLCGAPLLLSLFDPGKAIIDAAASNNVRGLLAVRALVDQHPSQPSRAQARQLRRDIRRALA